MISLHIDGVVKRFGKTVALDGVSLEIAPGEIFFLLGPSGCGKTTLLRTIAGFNIPDAGRILFGEDDVTKLPPHKRETGMMFQSYALWPHLTVAQNVAFGLEERKTPAAEITQRVGEALETVRMGGYGDRRIHQLSGGQQQRVALARALVIRPRCLLLDEPLSNLDARLRVEMRGEIRRVCKAHGVTAVYVTHDQKEALSVADRMAILEGGHIRQVGVPSEVYRRPHSRFVADFMGETNFVEGTVSAIQGERIKVSTPVREWEGVWTTPGSPPAPGQAVTISIRPESWRMRAPADAPNALAGHLEETIYLGEVAQHRVRTGEREWKVFEMNPRPCAPGTAVSMAVDPDDVVILP